ncbi:MAG: hypothetical protein KDB14_09690 [Planctomycetales bacterium]|nr:hypothetical protein [Planctomycetales bacterium]
MNAIPSHQRQARPLRRGQLRRGQLRRGRQHRRGVSLLEVLFSIGVLSIGLLGVIVLLPLAANQVRKGVNVEQSAIVGMNALRELEMRGLIYGVDADPIGASAGVLLGPNETNWTHPDASHPLRRAVPGGGGSSDIAIPLDPTFDSAVPASYVPSCLCIDPRFVADNTVVAASFPNPGVFPALGASFANPPRMLRVTVRNGVNGGPMTEFAAERMLVDHDTLDFRRPADDTLPGEVIYELDTSGNVTVPKLTDGQHHLSWFATIVPRIEPQVAQTGTGNLDTLSVVVVKGRPSFLTITDPVALNLERMAVVTAFFSGGIGGGDVELTAASEDILNQVKVGEWIMLASRAQLNGTRQQDQFGWYRIGHRSEIQGAGPFTREVTLVGADWNRPEWTSLSIPTEAVIIEGAIGVYQRTIRREVSNMWN